MRTSLVSLVALGLFIGAPALVDTAAAQSTTDTTASQSDTTANQSGTTTTQSGTSGTSSGQAGTTTEELAAERANEILDSDRINQMFGEAQLEESTEIEGRIARAMTAEGHDVLVFVGPEDMGTGDSVEMEDSNFRDRFQQGGFTGLQVVEDAHIVRADLDENHYIFALSAAELSRTPGQMSGMTDTQTGSETGTAMGETDTSSGAHTTMGQTGGQAETGMDTESDTAMGETGTGTDTQAGTESDTAMGETGTGTDTELGTESETAMGETGTGTDTEAGTESETAMGETGTGTDAEVGTESETAMGETGTGTDAEVGTESETAMGETGTGTDTQAGTETETAMGTDSQTETQAGVTGDEDGQISRGISEPMSEDLVRGAEEAGLQDAGEFKGRIALATTEDGSSVYLLITRKDMQAEASVDIQEDDLRQKLQDAGFQDVRFMEDAQIVRGTLEGDNVFVFAGLDLMGGTGTQQ